MKTTVLLSMIACLFLAGCAQEAYYVDKEFGAASRDAFDRQIVNHNNPNAGKTPETLTGVHAEPLMGRYHQTFGEGFTSEDIDISDVGSESDNN